MRPNNKTNNKVIFSLLLATPLLERISAWEEYKPLAYAPKKSVWSNEIHREWFKLWKEHPKEGPGGRAGHTLLAIPNSTKLIMFGGRGNDKQVPHVPSTYELVEIDGKLEFTTYDAKPLYKGQVSPTYEKDYGQHEDLICQPSATCISWSDGSVEIIQLSSNEEVFTLESNTEEMVCNFKWTHPHQSYLSDEQEIEWERMCGFTPVATFLNDIWVFESNISGSCNQNSGTCDPLSQGFWRVLSPGAKFGNCRDVDNTEIKSINYGTRRRNCEFPSERFKHGAAMLDNQTMMIYGGNSQECGDEYCDDTWLFDLITLKWRIVTEDDDNENSGKHPGPRWRHSMLGGVPINGTRKVLVFGGHRHWHEGDNEVLEMADHAKNSGGNTTMVHPSGGYLNDMWIFHPNGQGGGSWEQIKGIPTCEVPLQPHPWDPDRGKPKCHVRWPPARAGHAAVYDPQKHGIWIFGGYTSFYPYGPYERENENIGIDATESGSHFNVENLWTASVYSTRKEKRRLAPFGTHPYFLDDMWFFDIAEGVWTEKIPATGRKPTPRMDHIMVIAPKDRIIILFGGFSDNVFYNDTWYFILDENRWLQKETFVHPKYPDESKCRNDLEFVNKPENNCVKLETPLPLKISKDKSEGGKHYLKPLPFIEQDGYTPNKDGSLYFGIRYNASEYVSDLQSKYLKDVILDEDGNRVWLSTDVPEGTPMAPYAATGPLQYAQLKKLPYNESFELHVWEWCTQGIGEPTRGTPTDGLNGRSSSAISIPQPRRRSFGWDGCRDNMGWIYPYAHAEHAAAYVGSIDTMFMYGGIGYENLIEEPTRRMTHRTKNHHDMWSLKINKCAEDCNHHGSCVYGYCVCHTKFYGISCANETCPGTSCFYDSDFVQHCSHCCHDGYVHNDETDVFQRGIEKLTCQRDDSRDGFVFKGRSHGVCDGFGSCQCIPPYTGPDCSIKDCKHSCSNNGACSWEFPVSRCLCKPGYFGRYSLNVFSFLASSINATSRLFYYFHRRILSI